MPRGFRHILSQLMRPEPKKETGKAAQVKFLYLMTDFRISQYRFKQRQHLRQQVFIRQRIRTLHYDSISIALALAQMR